MILAGLFGQTRLTPLFFNARTLYLPYGQDQEGSGSELKNVSPSFSCI